MSKKRTFLSTVLPALIALVVVASFVVPIPYYIEKPGATIDLKDLVTVNQQEDKSSGSFSLTSVGVQQATVASAISTYFSSFKELLSKEDMFGTSTSEEYNQMQNYYMTSSQNSAIEQALKAANRPYTFDYKGVYVMSILPESNFANKIAVGDTVTKVDGQSFENTEKFMSYVQGKKAGEKVTINFLHDGKEQEATASLIELPDTKNAGIGITLVDHTEVKSQDTIDFHVENIGGPSAGFMFTLEIYEQLTQQDLRKGKKIVGTGTMNSDGTIGRIGGIDKKVASASKEGMEIFFAPDDELPAEVKKANPDLKSNYQEAKAAAKKLNTKMKIVPVKTLQDALDYLKAM